MCGPPVLSAGSRDSQVHLNRAAVGSGETAAEVESVPCTLVGRGEFPQTFFFFFFGF